MLLFIALWCFTLIAIVFFFGDYTLGGTPSSWDDSCSTFASCFGMHLQYGLDSAPQFGDEAVSPGHHVLLFFAYT